MTTCIRRSKSYWTTCPCDPCVIDRARARKRNYVGIPHRIPQDIAWAKLANHIDNGWTARALGSAINYDPTYFRDHVAARRAGREVHLGPAVASAIMRMGKPTEGQIGAEPTRRRLRALACMGYGLDTLAVETSTNASTLGMIRRGNERVGAAIALRVSDAYDRLHMIPGPCGQAREGARARGWAPPLAWNNIDDPDEDPTDWEYVPANRAELLIDLDRRRAGISEVCSVLNLRRDSLEKWCERNKFRDLYVRLVERETPVEYGNRRAS